MKQIILSGRPFRQEFIEEMQEINSNYDYRTEIADDEWSQVAITLGWNKDWVEKLLVPETNLKWVQSISAGVDYLPLKEFAKYGILLSNASGIHAHAIADHVLTTILMKLRGFVDAIQLQQRSEWASRAHFSYSYLHEQRILIVGTGRIGQQLAADLEALGVRPVGINTSGHPAPHFHEVYPDSELLNQAAKADFVVNILPLTDQTYHLYDASFFAQLQPTASFVNVGRGPSVDTSALIATLQAEQFAFAALDVFEEEPLPATSPLWTMSNVLVTPHISGLTPHFQKVFMEIFLANLKSYTSTHSLTRNEVDLSKGY